MYFSTKDFLKYAVSIMVFFISIIGPSTRKPNIELKGTILMNPFAIKASDVEHTDSIKAIIIINSK